MKPTLLILLLIAGWALPARCDDPADAGFSPWMTELVFRQWKIDNVKGKHLYCPVIEGRMHNGAPEYRTKPVPVPHGFKCMAMTFRHLEEAVYNQRVEEFSHLEGFQQVWTQSFVDDLGVRRYQTVFVKLTKVTGGIGDETPGAPAAPGPTDSSDQ